MANSSRIRRGDALRYMIYFGVEELAISEEGEEVPRRNLTCAFPWTMIMNESGIHLSHL